jgi:D-threo-aldose 1-dehydrogenase
MQRDPVRAGVIFRAAGRRAIGRTGLFASALGFGGAALARIPGDRANETASATMRAAWEAGIRYFDTAPQYGRTLSEQRLGAGLWSHARDAFVLSTKVGRVMLPTGAAPERDSFYSGALPFVAKYDYTYDGVMRSFEDSLQRLGLNRIDLLLVHDLTGRHHPDAGELARYEAELFEGGGYKALAALREQKVIHGIGAGLNSWRQCEHLALRGDFDVFLLAGHYTLLDQDAQTSFLPMCARTGVGVILGGVYNTGILVTGTAGNPQYDYRPANEEVKARVAAIESVCREFDVPMAAAALQFPLHHPAIATVIPGMSTPEEVSSNVAYMETRVPNELYDTLKKKGLMAADCPTA